MADNAKTSVRLRYDFNASDASASMLIGICQTNEILFHDVKLNGQSELSLYYVFVDILPTSADGIARECLHYKENKHHQKAWHHISL
jgi:hypothetical protein